MGTMDGEKFHHPSISLPVFLQNHLDAGERQLRDNSVLELGLNEVTSIKHWLIRPLLGKHSYSTGEIKLNPYTSPAFMERII